ncbi:MAG: SLBB domain-containing protein [Paludibacteraceae bacterium]|nr:SLBB domain-containing protein [Paludibacteraceae bacterium]
MIKRLNAFTIFLFGFIFFAVAGGLSLNELQSVKVDQLKDSQISDFVRKYTDAGYTLADIEQIAKARRMPSSEWEKLKVRINGLESQESITSEISEVNEKIQENEEMQKRAERSGQDNRIFGASLFSNSKVSFEPSQAVATPRNYVIGPNDVLHIDVFGMAEATYDLTVNKEGHIRIPNAGVVQVSGLAIENAEKIIKKKLAGLYSSINTGGTNVNVTINNIRSIKVYIMGEVMTPGSYTLTSVSSVFNALNACGGPSINGTMRNIKVIRSGKEIATVDLYEVLTNGVMPSNTTLQDQDVIQVPTYGIRVDVSGEVKREGIYEMKEGETLQKLIDYCGGFTDKAYTERISVTRNINGEKSVADVSKELFGMFTPQPGDVYRIGQILEKYSNRVQIIGSVFRPGVYALDERMTLKDLVKKADGLTEDAFMGSATIVRLQDDLTPEIISFNVKDLMDGNFNIELKKEDMITIGGKNEFDYKKQIIVRGRVLSPGAFPYYENATLRDMIFLSKGFEENADPSKIEVVRMVQDTEELKNGHKKSEIFILALDNELNGADGDFKLMPNDQITIRTKEGYEKLGSIQIVGEARQAGEYAITSKTERISDVIARAGGITQYAYPKGAFLIRKSNRTEAERQRDMKIIEMLNNAEDDEMKQKIRKELMERQDLVGIQLDKIIEDPIEEESNLIIENGDIIFIPQELQTITIGGAVQVPGKEVYNTSRLRKYVRGAGGFTSNARKKSVYVAYPSGRIASTKHILWMKNYPKVEPGSHIYIPEKIDKSSDSKERTQFIVSISSSVVTMASVVVTMMSVVANNNSKRNNNSNNSQQ